MLLIFSPILRSLGLVRHQHHSNQLLSQRNYTSHWIRSSKSQYIILLVYFKNDQGISESREWCSNLYSVEICYD